MTELRWEDPPASIHKRGGGWGGQILRQLAERPGEWAMIYEAKPSDTKNAISSRTANLKTVAMRSAVAIEAVSRTVDGVGRIYARVLADASSSELADASSSEPEVTS